jgi:two-component system, OmpR family, phosphate regulon sensor histidine kinase PhoR
MNFSTSQRLSFLASLVIAGVFALVYTSVKLFTEKEWDINVFLLTNLIILPVSYFFYKYILDKFIYEKIRLIYKTIHDQKSPKKASRSLILNKNNIIEETRRDVLEWAENKTREIDDLMKLEAYRREFMGNVSHELKTPIFNIQGYILTLLDGGMDDPQINRKYLERSEQSIERMISIVEDLEAISRFEAGELRLKFENFDIVALTRSVMEFIEIKAEKKNIRIALARSYDMPIYVYADKQRIQQVLTNLIVNSIKYGTENGRTKISFFDMDENILVEVTDSGVGIPREELPRIFERFYRGDRSRTRKGGEGGSGLGLAIVKHIIEAHEQTINVRSTLGVGSTFAFTLKKGRHATVQRRPLVLFL